jgi:hypothetical protein
MNRHYEPMQGHLPELGLAAGFMSPGQYRAIEPGPSIPIITRGLDKPVMSAEMQNNMALLQRGEFTGDVNQVLMQLGMSMAEMNRAITTTSSAFPVRENLEAEAKILVPLDTPFRNRLARRMGAGLASKWKQLVSLGGGYAAATATTATATTTGSPVSIAVTSSSGFSVGDFVYIDNGNNQEYLPVTAIADGTHLSLNIAKTHTGAGIAVVKAQVETGSQQGNIRAFFAETGAPAEHTSVYADQTASYKLLGTFGQVSGFAMAAGANFQNQLAIEKRNAIMNLMLNEENALINGDGTSTAAPWGDGTNALAFSGINNLVSTANGTPADQIQTAVGSWTTAHIDQQLRRLYNQGAQGKFLLLNPQEVMSLVHLAEASGSIIRVQATSTGQTVIGVTVTGYVDPITGEIIPIITSRFQPPGTVIYGSDRLPDGTPTADVEVLPQVQLPELAPDQDIQGYTAQEIAPSTASPQMYPFICTVFEVLRLKSAAHYAKDTGVSAV